MQFLDWQHAAARTEVGVAVFVRLTSFALTKLTIILLLGAPMHCQVQELIQKRGGYPPAYDT